MIRAPARPNSAKQRVSRPDSIPFTYKGWNARDPISDMDPAFAVILDNIFPDTSKGFLRKGSMDHATGLSGQVETLMEFADGDGDEFFAASDGNIYDVSSDGAVGAAVVTGKTNAKYQHIVFGASGTRYLFAVNGADAPIHYNGTTWANPTLTGTGFTPSKMIHVNEFKERIFLIEKESLSFWYLNTIKGVAGTVSEFPLESLFDKGGYLMAMATWSIDGGAGLDDVAVFITSKGQVAVYQGTDPAFVATWALIGVFEIGRPIGRRCFMKLGGDTIIVTENGFVPLSLNLLEGNSNKRIAVSDNIRGAVSSASVAYKDNFGWQPILYPRGNMALFNIPIVENSMAHQYVMNTTTGAWCRFKEWDANCLGIFNGDLYFGGNTKVLRANFGAHDNNANIQGDLAAAYNYLGRKGLNKQFKMLRPIIETNGLVNAALGMNVDFQEKAPFGVPTFEGGAGAVWDVAAWDTSDWAAAGEILKAWQTVNGVGYAASVRMRLLSNVLDIAIHSFDVIYEIGNPV